MVLWNDSITPFKQLKGKIQLTRSSVKSLDFCMVFGVFCTLIYNKLTNIGVGGNVVAIVYLIGNLRFVGISGWILSAMKGWRKRLGCVMFLELYFASATGFFLEFLLWSIVISILCFYRFSFSSKKIIGIMFIAILLLPALQHSKWEYRNAVWYQYTSGEKHVEIFGSPLEVGKWSKPFIYVGKLLESMVIVVTMRWGHDFFNELIVRYNQSWIVERVMIWVPTMVPYAEGSTVKNAIISTLVPRVLFPNKMSAGGGENFTRFTGVILNRRTSMNLGYAGEMYANFGYTGGIIACGCYGLVLGLIFRWLIIRAQRNILYLAFVPYVMQSAILSEVGIFEVSNTIFKSIVIVLFLNYLFPKFLSNSGIDPRIQKIPA